CNSFDIRSDQSGSFTATAQDACGASAVITARDCWAPGPGGTHIDKRSRCTVTFSGATVNLTLPGDPGDHVEWTAVATDAGGTSTTMVCSIVVQPPLISAVGCADGQREGFRNLTTYPNIAGCSGAWTIPGIHGSNPGIAPACGTPTFDTV